MKTVAFDVMYMSKGKFKTARCTPYNVDEFIANFGWGVIWKITRVEAITI